MTQWHSVYEFSVVKVAFFCEETFDKTMVLKNGFKELRYITIDPWHYFALSTVTDLGFGFNYKCIVRIIHTSTRPHNLHRP